MKKAYLIIIALFAITVAGCEKYKNPIPDFQNTLPGYVQIINKANKTVVQSAAYTLALSTFYAFNEDININYELVGLTTTTGTIILPKQTRSVTVNLTAPSTPQTLMLNLTGTSSTKLTVGKLSSSSEVVKITVIP